MMIARSISCSRYADSQLRDHATGSEAYHVGRRLLHCSHSRICLLDYHDSELGDVPRRQILPTVMTRWSDRTECFIERRLVWEFRVGRSRRLLLDRDGRIGQVITDFIDSLTNCLNLSSALLSDSREGTYSSFDS